MLSFEKFNFIFSYENLGLGMELLARISEDSKLKKYLRKVSGPTASAVMNGSKKQSNLATSDVTTDSLQLVSFDVKVGAQNFMLYV